jgi:hypothetical protein
MQTCQVVTVVHVMLVLLVDEVTPLPALSCELVERSLGSAAAGAALEMNDLGWASAIWSEEKLMDTLTMPP